MDTSYYKKYEPIFGEWKIVREIGEGSFGKVFEIEREDFGYTYKAALKAITIPQSESELDNLLGSGMSEGDATAYCQGIVKELNEEFRLMSTLKGNSNIVSYEDHKVIPHDGDFGYDILIRMELLTPLMRYYRYNPLDRNGVVQLGIDICKALELCKNHGIVHRDIKPENIFISNDGLFKLGDFGIAKTMEHTTGSIGKKGTYNYMAPEVYKGEPYGSRVDIYSLGIMLYRFLNGGRLPFQPPAPAPLKPSDNEQAIARRVSGEPIPAPANADPELAAIILKACAYLPEDRYASPTEMRKALEALITEDAGAAIPAAIDIPAGETSSADAETVVLFIGKEPTADLKPSAEAAPEAPTISEPAHDTKIKNPDPPAKAVTAAVFPPQEKPAFKYSAPTGKIKPSAPTQKTDSKKLRLILSAVALAVCLLCAVLCLIKVGALWRDIANIYDYRSADLEVANDGVAQLEDGIEQLKENEQTYLDGVDTYLDGEAQLAEGQALIDANTEAYLEGKETIASLESIMPEIEALASSVQDVRDYNAGVIDGDLDTYLGEQRAAALNLLANEDAVATLSDTLGMDVGSILASNPDDTSLIGNIINMYYDGLAQLKQYEDGLERLADAEAGLEDGDVQLSVFEDGEVTLAEGVYTLMMGMTPSYHPYSHEQTVDSLAERLAAELGIEIPELYVENCAASDEDGFSYVECLDMEAYSALAEEIVDALYQKEGDEYVCASRDDKTIVLLDLDKCDLVVEHAKAYLEEVEDDSSSEISARCVSLVLAAVTAVFCTVSALICFLFAGKGKKSVELTLSSVSVLLAVSTLVAAIKAHYTDLVYGIRVVAGTYDYSIASSQDTSVVTDVIYSGHAYKSVVFLVLAAAAIFCAVVVVVDFIRKKDIT